MAPTRRTTSTNDRAARKAGGCVAVMAAYGSICALTVVVPRRECLSGLDTNDDNTCLLRASLSLGHWWLAWGTISQKTTISLLAAPRRAITLWMVLVGGDCEDRRIIDSLRPTLTSKNSTFVVSCIELGGHMAQGVGTCFGQGLGWGPSWTPSVVALCRGSPNPGQASFGTWK